MQMPIPFHFVFFIYIVLCISSDFNQSGAIDRKDLDLAIQVRI